MISKFFWVFHCCICHWCRYWNRLQMDGWWMLGPHHYIILFCQPLSYFSHLSLSYKKCFRAFVKSSVLSYPQALAATPGFLSMLSVLCWFIWYCGFQVFAPKPTLTHTQLKCYGDSHVTQQATRGVYVHMLVPTLVNITKLGSGTGSHAMPSLMRRVAGDMEPLSICITPALHNSMYLCWPKEAEPILVTAADKTDLKLIKWPSCSFLSICVSIYTSDDLSLKGSWWECLQLSLLNHSLSQYSTLFPPASTFHCFDPPSYTLPFSLVLTQPLHKNILIYPPHVLITSECHTSPIQPVHSPPCYCMLGQSPHLASLLPCPFLCPLSKFTYFMFSPFTLTHSPLPVCLSFTCKVTNMKHFVCSCVSNPCRRQS